jgi:hypothetical protein
MLALTSPNLNWRCEQYNYSLEHKTRKKQPPISLSDQLLPRLAAANIPKRQVSNNKRRPEPIRYVRQPVESKEVRKSFEEWSRMKKGEGGNAALREKEERALHNRQRKHLERTNRMAARGAYRLWADTKTVEAKKIGKLPGARNHRLGFGLPKSHADRPKLRYREKQHSEFKTAAKSLLRSLSANEGLYSLESSNAFSVFTHACGPVLVNTRGGTAEYIAKRKGSLLDNSTITGRVANSSPIKEKGKQGKRPDPLWTEKDLRPRASAFTPISSLRL